MDKYRVVEKPRVEAELKPNEIRITTQGKMRNSISYATTLFKDKGATEVVLKAMGRAINKTVTIAEIIKRRIAGLHQITVIDSTDITDVYEPIEEGLDRLETTRHVSSITITLSTAPLDTSAPGYQPPIPEDQVKEITLAQKAPRRPAARGRGRGRRGPAQQQPQQQSQQQQPQQTQQPQQGGADQEDELGPRPRGRGRGRRPRTRRPRASFTDGDIEYPTEKQGGNDTRQGNNNFRQQGNGTRPPNNRQQAGRPQAGYGGRAGGRSQSGGGRGQQGFGQHQSNSGGDYNAQGQPAPQSGQGRGRGRRPRGRGRGGRGPRAAPQGGYAQEV